MPRTFVLTLSCPQRPGIVHAVTAFLFTHGCDIVEHQQFDDPIRGALFLRTEVAAVGDVDAAQLSAAFRSEVADEFGMDYQLSDDGPQRVLVMVSKMGHCLNDLIFRWRAGSLGADIVAVVSNHEDLRPMAEAAGLPFHHVPVTPEAKPQAEQRLLELVDEYRADVVVLARYMQVLSDSMCLKLLGRAINIHHSFLPGFKGAKPYHQAYDRGVKLVGATAHYVTPDLDEGPIIEQEVIRIDHTLDPVTRYLDRRPPSRAAPHGPDPAARLLRALGDPQGDLPLEDHHALAAVVRWSGISAPPSNVLLYVESDRLSIERSTYFMIPPWRM